MFEIKSKDNSQQKLNCSENFTSFLNAYWLYAVHFGSTMEGRESFNKDSIKTKCMYIKCGVFCILCILHFLFLDKKKDGQNTAILLRKLSLGKGFSHHNIHYDSYFLKKITTALTNIIALFLPLLSLKVKGGKWRRCSTHKIMALSWQNCGGGGQSNFQFILISLESRRLFMCSG